MPNAQSLGITLLCIVGACAFLALGAFAGSKMSPGKLATFAGVLALIAIVFFAVFSAVYFLTKAS
jgi:hypothetical protein